MQHREFEAWVECAGHKAEVYGISIEDRKMSGWIVSEPGQISVHVKDLACKSDATTRVFLDGVAGGANTTRRPGEVLTRATFRTGPTTVRPYQFSSIKLTDNESVAMPGQAAAAELGTIRVDVNRVIVTGRVPATPKGWSDPSGLAEKTVHEKDKKLGRQCVSLAAEQRATARGHKTVKRPYDRNDKLPWVQFEFRYRSRAFLEAQEIIPRSGSLDEEGVREVNEASRPQKKQKVDDAARQAEIAALKECLLLMHDLCSSLSQARLRQLESHEEPEEKAVKLETRAQPSPFKKNEVIDLTSD